MGGGAALKGAGPQLPWHSALPQSLGASPAQASVRGGVGWGWGLVVVVLVMLVLTGIVEERQCC